MLKPEHLRKMLQLVRSKRLGEEVRNLPIGSNILKFNFTAQDLLAHRVIMHLNVLCGSMEYRVLGQLHTANVVVVDQD